jgi:hypothetical protein
MLYFIYFCFIFLYVYLASLRHGLHVVTLLGLPQRCRESGFRPRKSGSFQKPHKSLQHIIGSPLATLQVANNLKEW